MLTMRPSCSRSVLVLAAAALVACSDDAPDLSGTPGDGGSGPSTTVAVSASGADESAASASSSSTGEPEVCPWFGEDPGTLVATGAAIGDVIENVGGLLDQCGVARSLWDFAGGYRILSMTPGW